MKHLPDLDPFWHQSEPARDEARVEVRIDSDVVVARQKGRELARKAGFTGSDVALIATAIREVARSIVTFAEPGLERHHVVGNDGAGRNSLIARDQGPGIHDVDEALRDGSAQAADSASAFPVLAGSWTNSTSTRESVNAQSSQWQNGAQTRAAPVATRATGPRRRQARPLSSRTISWHYLRNTFAPAL